MRRQSLVIAGAAGLTGVIGGLVLQRRHTGRVAADPEREFLEQPPSGEPLEVTSADGTRLHAEIFGRADGPTLVLAHGWTEALRYWIYVIRELSDEFRIVAYDMRGHGESGRPPDDDYSIARFGEDVEAVLEAAVPDGQRAIIAGHSLGGMAIAAWAEDHDVSARANAAALLFTGVGELTSSQLIAPLPHFARALQTPIARGFLGSAMPLPRASTPLSHAIIRHVAFGRTATPAQVAFYERMLNSCVPDVRAAVGLAVSDIDLYEALSRLTVPTLVMAGADDRLTPASHAERMAAALPNLQALIELPDTGHMGPLERPREVADALRALCRGAERVDGAAAAVAS